MNDNQVYWDSKKQMFYWIEWYDTGNGEIPTKHYIIIKNDTKGRDFNSIPQIIVKDKSNGL